MSRGSYYNEWEPYPAQWLRNLMAAGHIPQGEVDERSITDVQPDDLRGFTQCHFFAGIGGWAYAARLAGWPDDRELWTGSCPCQPFSSATRGRGKRTSCERHLWPVWFQLIAASRHAVVFGEQVSGARDWLDGVTFDMGSIQYAVEVDVLPAFVVGADHARERIYFTSYTNGYGKSRLPIYAEASRLSRFSGEQRGMVPAHGLYDDVACLRAFGNAIVPQVAAEVIAAFMECRP